jgi:hypothetical protein
MKNSGYEDMPDPKTPLGTLYDNVAGTIVEDDGGAAR